MTEVSLYDSALPLLTRIAGEDLPKDITSRLLWELYAPEVNRLTDPTRMTVQIRADLELQVDPNPAMRQQPGIRHKNFANLIKIPVDIKGTDIRWLIDDIEERIATSDLYQRRAWDYGEDSSWELMDYGRDLRKRAHKMGHVLPSLATYGDRLMVHATLLRYLPEIDAYVRQPRRDLKIFNETAMLHYSQRFEILAETMFDR